MTVIEIPDDQAAVLRARAAAEGLILADWLQKLAGIHAPAGKSRYNLSELVAQCDPNALLSAEDRAWLDAPSVGRDD